MESLERALQAMRPLLEENPESSSNENTTNPSRSKKFRRPIDLVLNIPPGQRLNLQGNLKDATYEIHSCRHNNKRAFKYVWNLYVIFQQSIGRDSSLSSIDNNIQDSVKQLLDSILHTFRVHPFAVSHEEDSPFNLSTLAVLNDNPDTATRHEQLVRRIGKVWVDDRVRGYHPRIRDLASLQASLFELLWSGTVEQLKMNIADSADDPEGPEFEKVVKGLESSLQEAIVRSKKQPLAITLCGMIKAGKSLFLNALMGRMILPSDGEANSSHTPRTTLNITTELRSTVWPCRLRHVEGQTVPELHFQAGPFLSALEKLKTHQGSREMQSYQSWRENTFEALLSDIDDVTRDNLLKFENPGFTLPQTATGEQDVKNLVSFTVDGYRHSKLNSVLARSIERHHSVVSTIQPQV